MTKPYTPQLAWPKLEIHVDYRCDLMCTSCSRGSFLRKPHTPPITLAQIKDAFRQADGSSGRRGSSSSAVSRRCTPSSTTSARRRETGRAAKAGRLRASLLERSQ